MVGLQADGTVGHQLSSAVGVAGFTIVRTDSSRWYRPNSAHTVPTIRRARLSHALPTDEPRDSGTLSVCALLSEECRDVWILGRIRSSPLRFHARHQDDVNLSGELGAYATATVDAWYTSVGIG
jgi:hypothetical protein